MPRRKTDPSDQQDLLDSLETPEKEISVPSMGLSNKEILKVAAANAVFQDALTRYGMPGAVKRKRELAASIVRDGMELLKMVDDL